MGVAGVFLDPLKGFKDGGVTGGAKGMVKGVVGLVVKPVSGALGLVNNLAEGIAATGAALDGSEPTARSRMYRPRFTSPDLERGFKDGPKTRTVHFQGSRSARAATAGSDLH